MSVSTRRLGARAAVIASVALAGPVALAGAALACGNPPPSSSCVSGASAIKVDSFSATTGQAVVELASGGCSGQVVSLAAYQLEGSSRYPQQLADLDQKRLWSGWKVSLHVKVPPCANQIDLVAGSDIPKTLTQAYFTPAGTLLAAGTSGTGTCTAPPPCHH